MQDASEECNEEWRAVVGAEGWYEVSSLGRIKRLVAAPRTRPGYILNPTRNEKGYLQTALKPAAILMTVRVHKVVADAFLGPRPPGYHINHKDLNKINNAATNLEYITPRANTLHALVNGAVWGSRKLTPESVRQIRDSHESVSVAQFANRLNVSKSAIRAVIARKSWQWLD